MNSITCLCKSWEATFLKLKTTCGLHLAFPTGAPLADSSDRQVPPGTGTPRPPRRALGPQNSSPKFSFPTRPRTEHVLTYCGLQRSARLVVRPPSDAVLCPPMIPRRAASVLTRSRRVRLSHVTTELLSRTVPPSEPRAPGWRPGDCSQRPACGEQLTQAHDRTRAPKTPAWGRAVAVGLTCSPPLPPAPWPGLSP